MTDTQQYDWLEIKMRPKIDGLHDSGYRFIQITGVALDENRDEIRTPLNQWSDHVLFTNFMDEYQGVNIDFTADGVMRIMGWGGAVLTDDMSYGVYGSTAWFRARERTE